MTNSIGDQTPPQRREIFEEYLMYYDQAWQNGTVKVCRDRQVTERARHVLLSETDPVERFTTFDFYHTAFECVNRGVRDCRSVFNVFIKAVEVLETLCVNLFLFPWKKEIKTIKTFTGPFVYCVQPVFPRDAVRALLERVGYYPESDTEYRLRGPGADPTQAQAKATGFELFLARVECEYLLEAMGQRAHAECLDILRRRAAPQQGQRDRHSSGGATEGEEEEEEPRSETARAEKDRDKDQDKDSEGLRVDQGDQPPLPDVLSLAEPVVGGAQTAQGPSEESLGATAEQEKSKPLRLEAEGGAGGAVRGSGRSGGADAPPPPEPSERQRAGSLLSEDRSILEMRHNYPDLAIRQKPIFRKQRGGSYPTPGTKARSRLGDDGDVGVTSRGHTAITAHASDLSGPQSISVHPDPLVPQRPGSDAPVDPLPKPGPPAPDEVLEPQPLVASSGPASVIQYREVAMQSATHRPSQQGAAKGPDLLLELTNRLGQLRVSEMSVDEPLKYPIEETQAEAQPPCSTCHDHHRPAGVAPGAAPAAAVVAPPTGSPRDGSHQPILCSPSPLPVCSISGCSNCTGPDVLHPHPHHHHPHHSSLHVGASTIKEPPSSIYMPPSPLGMCGPPLEPPAGHLAASVPGPLGHTPGPLGQSGTEGRGPSQQPEDELLQTYVLVEPDRK